MSKASAKTLEGARIARGRGPLLAGGTVAALSLLVGLSVDATPANAAFPGTNGRIACDGIRGPVAPARSGPRPRAIRAPSKVFALALLIPRSRCLGFRASSVCITRQAVRLVSAAY